MNKGLIWLLLACWSSNANAEMVEVKYRGTINLSHFECEDITRSSFVNRICHDGENSYMIILLRSTYYHYCDIDAGTVSDLSTAPSIGRFYNQQIKGNFSCQTGTIPKYGD